MVQPAKILVAEDNNFVRMQIVKFLKDEGFEVIECTDGSQALDSMSNDIEMAIVDVRMEPLDGLEFIKSIRGQDIKTPIILVTGDQNPDLLNEANKWSVTAVLMKPVQKDRLIKTVTRTIEARRRQS
ncbi:MAG: response regulator [Micavibrio sp.]|nr:response regulator [Micavibrio sp.]